MRTPLSRRKAADASEAASNGHNGSLAINGQEPADVDLEIRPDGKRLGELLVSEGVLSTEALEMALVERSKHPDRRIGTVLVESGAITEEQLAAVLGRQLGIPVAELQQAVPEPEALAALPEPVARLHLALPLRFDGDTLEVVVVDPSPEIQASLQQVVERPMRLMLGTPSEVSRLIDTSYRVLGDVERFVKAFETTDLTRSSSALSEASAAAMADDAPVIQVMNLLLTQALHDRASDVHIEPMDTSIRVRFRIDGALHESLTLPVTMAAALSSRLKIMAELNIVERRRPQDGQFTIEIDGRPIDMRLSVLPTIWGEKSVIRILDTRRSALPLSELGMPKATFETFNRIIHNPFGMVLCAGPTGSGKTTTLYGALREINEPHRNITTIEDPVEYTFPSINQIQTNDQAGMNFASGLKSILRQDPDVILVGEIRDAETARIAVQSALTGHFVLSTLHGTDAVAALHRLLDMGIESFLIASSVVAVVGQRLVRRTCPACREAYTPNDEELAFYEETGGTPKDVFIHGVGCNFCAGTGYQDRIGVYELLRITPEIKRLVVGWATQDELRRMATQQGMRTLQQEAITLVEQDVTTISEVIRSIYAL